MDYTYILLFVLCGAIFAQFLRLGQHAGGHVRSVVTIHFIVASIGTAIIWAINIANSGGNLTDGFTLPAVIAGCVTGCAFCSHFPFVLGAYRTAGVGITSTIIRIGVVIPAVVAWLAWDEEMTTLRWIALSMVPVAAILLRKPTPGNRHLTLKSDIYLLGSLVVGAVIFTMYKYANVNHTYGEQEIYKVFAFASAAAISTSYLVIRKVPISTRDVLIGTALGAANVATMLVVMLGLAVTPAVIFYPSIGCLGICASIFLSRLFWKEKLIPLQIVGVLIAILIVILINM